MIYKNYRPNFRRPVLAEVLIYGHSFRSAYLVELLPPPYRKRNGGRSFPPVFSSFLGSAGVLWRKSAEVGGSYNATVITVNYRQIYKLPVGGHKL